MGYEFVRDDGQEDRPVSPEFWRHAAKRIYQVPINEVVLVSAITVLHDPETGALGIDTQDRIPEVPSTSQLPIAIMKVAVQNGEDLLEGFLVDLRRKNILEEYSLTFSDPDEYMRDRKTVPPIGAVFQDSTGNLYFNSEHYELLLPFALSLVEQVDQQVGTPTERYDAVPSGLRPVFLRPNAG
jgi:hypothetical protein